MASDEQQSIPALDPATSSNDVDEEENEEDKGKLKPNAGKSNFTTNWTYFLTPHCFEEMAVICRPILGPRLSVKLRSTFHSILVLV
jgi:hypothetical protein